jgi:hypothetical protein
VLANALAVLGVSAPQAMARDSTQDPGNQETAA